MASETARDKIVKALLEHSRKQGKPLSEMDIVRGIHELYARMGEASIHRYRGNVALLAEDIHAALRAQERAGGLRPILVKGAIKLVPAGKKVTAPIKVAPISSLVKKKGIIKRLV